MARPFSTAKRQAHESFDVIWKSGLKTRTRAYRWLSWKLGVEPGACHFSLLTLEKLREARSICDEYVAAKR